MKSLPELKGELEWLKALKERHDARDHVSVSDALNAAIALTEREIAKEKQ